MIFLKGNRNNPRPLGVTWVRWASLVALISFPIGAILMLHGELQNSKGLEFTGLGLVTLSVLCFAIIVSTGLQRITFNSKHKLDELELSLRQKAYSRAYHVLGVIVLLGLFYLDVASDTESTMDLWTPSVGDHWQMILWGGILYTMVLPTALLAWSMPTEEVEDDTPPTRL